MAGKLPMIPKLEKVISYNGSTDDDEDNNNSESGSGLELSLNKLNLGSKKKLLVLPLGGFLIHRVHLRNKDSVRGYEPDYVHGKFLLFKRPFSSDFLKFCFERFEVGIWSSAREHNVDAALRALFGPLERKFAFVWDQDECTDSGFPSLENEDKPIFLKELTKIWDNYRGLSWRKGKYSSSNTLLICEPTMALLNPVNTCIFLNDYKVNNGRSESFLGPKEEFRAFLDGLTDGEDVPSYLKDHPFGQPAITTKHPDWGYYSKIVETFRKGKGRLPVIQFS